MSDIAIGVATAAKTGSTAPVTIGRQTVTCQVARDLTVAAGDPVILNKVGSVWYVIGRLYASAPIPPDESSAPPPPKPSTVTGTLVVSPVETRSYRSGGWRTDNDDVYQGQYGGNGNHTGCAFFGTKPQSLDGATVTSATIKVKRQAAGGITAAQSTTMRLVTQKTRPSGAPTLTSSTSGPSLKWGASTTFTIPTAWAQAMVDGTAGGIAFFDSGGSPYVIFEGRGDWSSAFTLTINWSRTT